MEPPSKKPRLSHCLDQDSDELDLNIEDLALDRQFQRSTYRSAFSFKSTLENIFEKYGKDFGDEGDEIDLNTGKITIDRGHFRGIFGGNLPVAVRDDGAAAAGHGDGEGCDDDHGIDLNQLYSDDDEEDGEEDEQDEGSIDLEADEDVLEESSYMPPLDAIPDLPDIPEPPQLHPSFGALEASVNGGPSTPGTLLGTLNRLLTMAVASRGASDPSFDPLSITNELVEPAWRVPALPPSLLQKKATTPVNTKGGVAVKSSVRKRRPRSTHDTDSDDEITTQPSNIGPRCMSLNPQNPSLDKSHPGPATSPEYSGCLERSLNQELDTRSTSRVDRSKHRKPHSVTACKSPPPTKDERDMIKIQCTETGDSRRPLKRNNETIVINIIDEKLRKLGQTTSLTDSPVETQKPMRQEAPVRDDSVIESDPKVLESLESSGRARGFVDEGLVETSTESGTSMPGGQASTDGETTRSSPRPLSDPKKRPGNQVKASLETFTRNHVDPSYGFSDEEDGGWVSNRKAAVRACRRRPPIFQPRGVSPELGSPPRPARSPSIMPEPAAVADGVAFSNEPPSCSALDAEAESQSIQPLVVDTAQAHEDEGSSMLMDNQSTEATSVLQSPTLSSLTVEEFTATQRRQSSTIRQSVGELGLKETPRPENEQDSEQVSELELEQEQTPSESSSTQSEIFRLSSVPQNQRSPKSTPQSLSRQLGDKRSSGQQGSAYLPRRTRRQWPPEAKVTDEPLPTHDPRPATPSPPVAPTPSTRSVRSVTSLLSLVNDGSDEDELSTCFTPRSRSVASSGGYSGPARLSRDALSSPIKKKTPKTLSRRLFMTKASTSAHAKPKASSFPLLPGAHFHATPLPHRRRAAGNGGGSVRSRLNSSPVRSVVETPGGSKRRCGEQGFRCDRDWCFFCIGDQQ